MISTEARWESAPPAVARKKAEWVPAPTWAFSTSNRQPLFLAILNKRVKRVTPKKRLKWPIPNQLLKTATPSPRPSFRISFPLSTAALSGVEKGHIFCPDTENHLLCVAAEKLVLGFFEALSTNYTIE